MIDLEGDDLHAALLEDDAVAVELLDLDCQPSGGSFSSAIGS